MGIKEKLLSLFVKKQLTKQTVESTNITRYDTSSISIPKYSELSEEDRKTVDGYIGEVDMEKLDTLMLYADEMSRYANANTDLLVKLFERITSKPLELELDKLSGDELYERRLDSLIQTEQVELYRQGLAYLERESALRATALVEIAKRENKRKFDFLGLFGRAERLKRKSQTELLELVTERMKISKKTIEQQRQAATNAMQNEITVATSIDSYTVVKNRNGDIIKRIGKSLFEQAILKQRVDEARQMMELVIPQNIEIFKDIPIKVKLDESMTSTNVFNEKHTVKALAKAQRKLDIYAYTHRKELEQLRQEVLDIGQAEKNGDNREQLLEKIKNIQTIYKVFSQYLTPEDLQRLYQVKFDVLVTGINEQEESPFVGIKDKEEIAYYKSLIEEKLEVLLKGENPNLIYYFGGNKSKAIKLIKEILKAENKGFSVDTMLQNKRLLSFVLAFDSKDGVTKFVKEGKYFTDSDLVYSLKERELHWEDKLPLETVYQLEKLIGNIENNINVSMWVKLIQLGEHEKTFGDIYVSPDLWETKLVLPDGLINISTRDTYGNPYEKRLKECIRRADEIVCPSTLKRIDRLDSPAFLQTIKLNEGLRVIGQEAFMGCERLAEVYINEGLECVGKKAFSNNHSLRIFSVPEHKIDLMGEIFAIYSSPSWQEGFYFENPFGNRNITLRIRGTNIPQEMLDEYKETVYEEYEKSHSFVYGSEFGTRRINKFNRRIEGIEVVDANGTVLAKEIRYEESFNSVCQKIFEQIQNYKFTQEER